MPIMFPIAPKIVCICLRIRFCKDHLFEDLLIWMEAFPWTLKKVWLRMKKCLFTQGCTQLYEVILDLVSQSFFCCGEMLLFAVDFPFNVCFVVICLWLLHQKSLLVHVCFDLKRFPKIIIPAKDLVLTDSICLKSCFLMWQCTINILFVSL